MLKNDIEKCSSEKLGAISRLFAALSGPNRLAIIQALYDGPLTVTQIVKSCSMKQANVSKHLAVLHSHRWVIRKRDGIYINYQLTDTTARRLLSLAEMKLEGDYKMQMALFDPETKS